LSIWVCLLEVGKESLRASFLLFRQKDGDGSGHETIETFLPIREVRLLVDSARGWVTDFFLMFQEQVGVPTASNQFGDRIHSTEVHWRVGSRTSRLAFFLSIRL